MAWILTAAVAPVSYLEEQLGFAYIEVLTFEKSLALPTSSGSAGAGAPSTGALCPHTGSGFLTCFPLPCNASENCFFQNLFGAELCRVVGFYPKADVFGEGRRVKLLALNV